jgi:hypothetical protein
MPACLILAAALLQEPVPPAELTLDQVSKAVVLLHAPAAGPEAKAGERYVGTAFAANLNGRVFLVTAEHVTKELKGEASLTYGAQGDKAATVALAELVSKWALHGEADVAVAEVPAAHPVTMLLKERALLPQVFISKLEAPARERPLTTFGYPLGLGALLVGPDKRISPITRESRPASGLLTLKRFDTKQPTVMFLLDNPSIGGFSGAPVMLLPSAYSKGPALVFGGGSFCMGIVHGTIYDNTGGKMAAVVPVSYVVETLKKAYEAAPAR